MTDVDANADWWDADRARSMIGQHVLVGITRYEADKTTVISTEQFHGIIVDADSRLGIRINCRGQRSGEVVTLPPSLDAFKEAAQGEYRLKESGETVVDPDLTSTWNIYKPQN